MKVALSPKVNPDNTGGHTEQFPKQDAWTGIYQPDQVLDT